MIGGWGGVTSGITSSLSIYLPYSELCSRYTVWKYRKMEDGLFDT